MSAVVDASLLVAALSEAGAEGRWAADVVRAGNLIALRDGACREVPNRLPLS